MIYMVFRSVWDGEVTWDDEWMDMMCVKILELVFVDVVKLFEDVMEV